MHWSQSRMGFDPDKLYALGVRHVYVFPGQSTADWFCNEETFIRRLQELKDKKAETEAKYADLQVHFLSYSSSHPEGQTKVPTAYQNQIDIDGNLREGFVCLRDENYVKNLLERLRRVALSGFRRILMDDDLKDALCFCPLHIDGFSEALGRKISRDELAHAFTDTTGSESSVELRLQYIGFCRKRLFTVVKEIEQEAHGVNPQLRIGTCLPARRFQELTGIACGDILKILDTPEAPSFARLPGEHYSPTALDMACSLGYQTYFDSVLPHTYERCWETTAVGSAPYPPKTSSQLSQEGQIAESLSIVPVLWAWTEEFDSLHLWDGLIRGRQWPGLVIPRNNDRRYGGIPVFVQTGLAHELSLDELMKDGIIRGYQTLSLMGLPMRLDWEARPEDDTICLFGPQPRTVAKRAAQWLREGRTLIVDLPAAGKLCAYLPESFGFSLEPMVNRPHSEVRVSDGEISHSVPGFPADTAAVVVGKNVRALTRFRDASDEDIGIGIASVAVHDGMLLILPFDLSEINFRLGDRFHRDVLLQNLLPFTSGSLPFLDGEGFLQLVLFKEQGEESYVAINYSDHPVQAVLHSSTASGGITIDLESLGVRRGPTGAA
ncbi:MAG: hypothetical protein HYX78_10745 [Armatimonadetes bacterium]|nr:hypothetical protein [Armatimonadota bacterium]